MRGRRGLAYLLLLILVLQICATGALAASEVPAPPTRTINVVYDDSGSMIYDFTGKQRVDTWCQAKYAMEVFAALMGEEDTLNIYVMSEYEQDASAKPHLTLYGKDGQVANIAKVHGMVTDAGNTPFNTVRKAYQDVAAAKTDEKWLVILTDGAFQQIGQGDNIKSAMNQYFGAKSPDVKVVFLAIGSEVSDSNIPDPGDGMYVVKAPTSKDILESLTSISTWIYNSAKLPDLKASTKKISFDIPMSELTIFAQGANVKINSLKSASGKVYSASSNPANVQYSIEATINSRDNDKYKNPLVNEDLKGTLLTFEDSFPAGDYELDVTGARTIEIYYKPNIKIAPHLTNDQGQEVTSLKNLKKGEYTISFGFVDADTGNPVNEKSELLRDPSFTAWVTNNGIEHPNAYHSGDRISLEEGSLRIDSMAVYLDYLTVRTCDDYDIFEDKSVGLRILDSPEYPITKAGLDTTKPIKVQISVNTIDITPEVWNSMEVPAVSVPPDQGYGEFRVEKSETPGVYNLYPQLASGSMRTDLYQNCDFTISYSGKQGESTWAGTGSGTLQVNDTRSWLDRYLPLIIKWIIIALIIIFLAGYLPLFKHYLPKALKKRPKVVFTPMKLGILGGTGYGLVKKSLLSTLIPYRAQRGTIRFLPVGVAGAPPMRVKGGRNRSMILLNYRSYMKQSHIRFNGSPIPDTQKRPPRYTANVSISMVTQAMKYACTPAVK